MIRFLRPTIPEPAAWLPYLEEAYRQRFFTNFGPVATRLEQALTDKYGGGRRQAVLVANCTAGITAALLALRVKGSVVVPSFTFPATAHAVLQAGLRPVFCDVSAETWELAPEAVEELARLHHVGAIVHVRAFGFCRDLSSVEAVARRLGVPLIADSAAAFGGQLSSGEWVGLQADLEVFSLHATKVFGVGEGGVIMAPPPLVPALRQAVNFGLRSGNVVSGGFNGKLSDFHAAIGLAVLDRIDEFIERRRAVAEHYTEALERSELASSTSDMGRPPWQTFPMLVPYAVEADSLVELAKHCGVELRRYYAPALHETTFFRSKGQRLPVSSDLARRMVCLPVYADMADGERDEVTAVVNKVLVAGGRSSGREAA